MPKIICKKPSLDDYPLDIYATHVSDEFKTVLFLVYLDDDWEWVFSEDYIPYKD